MRALEIMSVSFISVKASEQLHEALTIMLGAGLSGLTVVDDHGRLVGMLTESDMLRRVELGTDIKRPRWLEYFKSVSQLSDEYIHSRGRRVDEVMTRNVITAEPDTTLDEIVKLMLENKLRRVPIVSHGILVGIVRRADLLRILNEKLHENPETARDDTEIANEILHELHQKEFLPRNIEVVVAAGHVTLEGFVTDEYERVAARVAAENIPGVKRVTDSLLVVDPSTMGALY